MTNIMNAKLTPSCHLEFDETCSLPKATLELLDELIGNGKARVVITPGYHTFTINGFSCIERPEESSRGDKARNK